jgi:hypothetical protein
MELEHYIKHCGASSNEAVSSRSDTRGSQSVAAASMATVPVSTRDRLKSAVCREKARRFSNRRHRTTT